MHCLRKLRRFCWIKLGNFIIAERTEVDISQIGEIRTHLWNRLWSTSNRSSFCDLKSFASRPFRRKWNKAVTAGLQINPNLRFHFSLKLITDRNGTYFYQLMGTFRKTWFMVTTASILCLATPFLVFGMMVFICMTNFCGFGICWGKKAYGKLSRMFSGREFGRAGSQ